MSARAPQHAVVANAAESRFEISDAAGLSMLQYSERDGALHLTHTGVPESLEGKGYGSALARAALEHAKREGKRVVPSCPFVAAYVRRHPEYAQLVAPPGAA